MSHYEACAKAIERIGIDAGVAEIHGQLVGQLCSQQNLNAEQWMTTALPELFDAINSGDALAQESAKILYDLFQQTADSLGDGQLGFQLLMPDDEQALEQRIIELGEWCQGFLLGLAVGGIKDFQKLPGELPDLMNDIVEISRAESYELENENEDEAAFMELSEYVRLGVMMVWEELHQLQAGSSDKPVLH
ncbi:MAG: UPF0149 family protein [Gammaproteobacteria bacterium]|nr:UPF0149 family protein [Gammaproteobacteria bacterium]MDH5777120.1 UPF0149 family protein [Gammaproteobacteria bacterium]